MKANTAEATTNSPDAAAPAGGPDFAVVIPGDESTLSPDEARAANDTGLWPVKVAFPALDDGLQFIADAKAGAAHRQGIQAAGSIAGIVLGQIKDAIAAGGAIHPPSEPDGLAELVEKAVRAALVVPASDMITRQQVAQILRVHPKTIATYVARDGLPAHGLGRNQYFSRVEVERWLLDRGSQQGAHTERHANSMARLRDSKGAK